MAAVRVHACSLSNSCFPLLLGAAAHRVFGALRQGACCDPAVGDADRSARKVNTPFCQDGPAPRVPSGTSGVVFRVSDCRAGFGTACFAQRDDEDVWIAGDQRHRVYSSVLFTFCVVCCDASNSKRIGGGNVTVPTWLMKQ